MKYLKGTLAMIEKDFKAHWAQARKVYEAKGGGLPPSLKDTAEPRLGALDAALVKGDEKALSAAMMAAAKAVDAYCKALEKAAAGDRKKIALIDGMTDVMRFATVAVNTRVQELRAEGHGDEALVKFRRFVDDRKALERDIDAVVEAIETEIQTVSEAMSIEPPDTRKAQAAIARAEKQSGQSAALHARCAKLAPQIATIGAELERANEALPNGGTTKATLVKLLPSVAASANHLKRMAATADDLPSMLERARKALKRDFSGLQASLYKFVDRMTAIATRHEKALDGIQHDLDQARSFCKDAMGGKEGLRSVGDHLVQELLDDATELGARSRKALNAGMKDFMDDYTRCGAKAKSLRGVLGNKTLKKSAGLGSAIDDLGDAAFALKALRNRYEACDKTIKELDGLIATATKAMQAEIKEEKEEFEERRKERATAH